ncbi:hypothetical protein QFC19_004040 [Naganishia cerealis]|uniref:Uncharacterized protein n=1 Tax=Naganishia cerealis TaxID=610337 RepID=A0ACC2VYR9_9TREE|nr:hypothetical protein QFC19_004040 [Naganishia cerealis]
MRLIPFLATTSALAFLTRAASGPPPLPLITTTAPAQVGKIVSHNAVQPTPTAALQKRCKDNESCADVTVGPEVPIAVTTTMMWVFSATGCGQASTNSPLYRTTKLVPCTTTTTVIDSQTSTLTLWSTEVQTSTEHISGVNTVTVWLVTPAPEIKSSTYVSIDTFTFVKTGTATSYWTESKAAQTSSSTFTDSATTWMGGGKQDCHECNNAQPPARTANPPQYTPPVAPPSVTPPVASPQLAWTQTTATGTDGYSTPTIAPVAGGGPAQVAAPPSGSAPGWLGNGSNNEAGVSAPTSVAGGGVASGVPIVTGPGPVMSTAQSVSSGSTQANNPPLSNSTDTKGVPIQQGTNGTGGSPTGDNAVNSPFGNDASAILGAMSASKILSISGLISLLVSGVVV